MSSTTEPAFIWVLRAYGSDDHLVFEKQLADDEAHLLGLREQDGEITLARSFVDQVLPTAAVQGIVGDCYAGRETPAGSFTAKP